MGKRALVFISKVSSKNTLQTDSRIAMQGKNMLRLAYFSVSFSLSPSFWLLAMRQSDIINKWEKVVRRDASFAYVFLP